MPKYTFECPECGLIEQSYVQRHIKEIACKNCCSEDDILMKRMPPSVAPTEVRETVDKLFNLQQRPDQRELVKQRRDEYYWSVEVPRMVNSGTYTVETMLEMGWIYFDDRKQMHINTKPPNKR